MLYKILRQFFFLIIGGLTVQSAIAQQHLQGGSITVSVPVYGNLYITGGKVWVNAPVHGDLIVAGGSVEINDSVYNDVLLVAGEATLKGFIGDDLRCAGGRVRVSGDVAGDMLAAAGEVVIDSAAGIGSVTGSGGRITINGMVRNDVHAAAENFILNGRIAGVVSCKAKEITVNGTLEQGGTLAAANIRINPAAWFGKPVRYWSEAGKIYSNNPFIRSSAIYDPSLRMEYSKWYYLGHESALMLILHLGMVVVFLMTIQFLFGRVFKEAGKMAQLRTGNSLLGGVLYFTGVPFLSILALATVIAIPLALIASVLYVMLLLVSGAITALLAAHWWSEKKQYDWPSKFIVLAATCIYILVKLVSLIPIAGSVALIILYCWAFGSIILAFRQRQLLKTSKKTTA